MKTETLENIEYTPKEAQFIENQIHIKELSSRNQRQATTIDTLQRNLLLQISKTETLQEQINELESQSRQWKDRAKCYSGIIEERLLKDIYSPEVIPSPYEKHPLMDGFTALIILIIVVVVAFCALVGTGVI